MSMPPEKRNPAGGPGSRTSASGHRFCVQHATAEPLLQRLEGVRKSGDGWRARCPACGGRSQKVSVAESAGRVLLHCFGGCRPEQVLAAAGLDWRDIMPPSHWPKSPADFRRTRQAIRESGWYAALGVLALEAAVVRMAAAQVARWQPLDSEDEARLGEAVERIGKAASALIEPIAWRPETQA